MPGSGFWATSDVGATIETDSEVFSLSKQFSSVDLTSFEGSGFSTEDCLADVEAETAIAAAADFLLI